MADLETAEETGAAGVATVQPADVLIGIPTPTPGALLRQRAQQVGEALRHAAPSLKFVVVYPATDRPGELSEAFNDASTVPDSGEIEANSSLRLAEFFLPHETTATVPWLGLAPAYARLAELATQMGASACAILFADLAALDARSVLALVEPVLDKRAELVMPLYAPSKYEGLLNSSILYPFTRSLYGRRVRYPLGPDFGVSTALLARMGKRASRTGEVEDDQAATWPATHAALSDSVVAQVHLDGRHTPQTEGLDLSTILSYLAGSLFSDAEKYAVVWQRLRGSQAGLVLGSAGAAAESDSVDARPMIEAFQLASRNLQEVWGLILPPVTLLEIKRLGRSAPEQFRIPDNLWARIIFDFALAYRLRTISRGHLLGALTPLYLGWVASYAQEIANADAINAEQRIEKLAKAFEDEKSYLVSRWRWPDRFNP